MEDSVDNFNYRIGTIPFSVTCDASGGSMNLGISVERAEGRWIDGLGAASVRIDPATVLSSLVTYWDRIAGPYAGQPSDRFAANLAELVGTGRKGPVTFVREGLIVCFETEGQTFSMGSESVIPIEVFLGLGSLLSRMAPDNVARMWRAVSAGTNLPPFPREDFCMDRPVADTRLETEWYAKALGQSVAYYELVANWLHARQLAYAVGAPGYTEPTREEYDVRTIHRDLPSMCAIDVIYDLSKDKLGFGISELRAQAIAQRNTDARTHTVFRRFFPEG
jgi:hypothetical protein